jgi:hypothetical protein
MNVFEDALTSQDFVRGVFLLVVTAALTGLLVPLVKARLDERRYRDQKVFESGLLRQAKTIDAQAASLDALSELFWGFLLRALALAWYEERRDAAQLEETRRQYEAKLEEAWTEYDAESWPFYARLRVETSKAQRLTSGEVQADLRALLEWFQSFDVEVTKAHEAVHDHAFTRLRLQIHHGAAEVDQALTRIANELRLGPSAVS